MTHSKLPATLLTGGLDLSGDCTHKYSNFTHLNHCDVIGNKHSVFKAKNFFSLYKLYLPIRFNRIYLVIKTGASFGDEGGIRLHMRHINLSWASWLLYPLPSKKDQTGHINQTMTIYVLTSQRNLSCETQVCDGMWLTCFSIVVPHIPTMVKPVLRTQPFFQDPHPIFQFDMNPKPAAKCSQARYLTGATLTLLLLAPPFSYRLRPYLLEVSKSWFKNLDPFSMRDVKNPNPAKWWVSSWIPRNGLHSYSIYSKCMYI
jgi:hypothetical protein